jgi:hypothetical protein
MFDDRRRYFHFLFQCRTNRIGRDQRNAHSKCFNWGRDILSIHYDLMFLSYRCILLFGAVTNISWGAPPKRSVNRNIYSGSQIKYSRCFQGFSVLNALGQFQIGRQFSSRGNSCQNFTLLFLCFLFLCLASILQCLLGLNLLCLE